MRMGRKSTSTRVFVLALLILSVLTSPLYGQRLAIRTSLCRALADPAQFDGRMVELHATWLTDGDCRASGELMLPFDYNSAVRYGVNGLVAKLLKKYGFDDVVRDRAWEEFDFSSRRLYTGLTLPAAGCCVYVIADFAGVLVIKRKFRFKNGFGNGWGHLGGSRFLLLLRSVSNVSPYPCAGTPRDVLPPIEEFPPQPFPDLSAVPH